jgi:hypothetical protein
VLQVCSSDKAAPRPARSGSIDRRSDAASAVIVNHVACVKFSAVGICAATPTALLREVAVLLTTLARASVGSVRGA